MTAANEVGSETQAGHLSRQPVPRAEPRDVRTPAFAAESPTDFRRPSGGTLPCRHEGADRRYKIQRRAHRRRASAPLQPTPSDAMMQKLLGPPASLCGSCEGTGECRRTLCAGSPVHSVDGSVSEPCFQSRAVVFHSGVHIDPQLGSHMNKSPRRRFAR